MDKTALKTHNINNMNLIPITPPQDIEYSIPYRIDQIERKNKRN